MSAFIWFVGLMVAYAVVALIGITISFNLAILVRNYPDDTAAVVWLIGAIISIFGPILVLPFGVKTP